ncbi:carbonic anhydrase [Chitinimonas sp.]|uniref:carbonic anhydrase n=1 Tax=Chitinimonas sp. TaxID=1934313 RepID=UPI0035B0E4F0
MPTMLHRLLLIALGLALPVAAIAAQRPEPRHGGKHGAKAEAHEEDPSHWSYTGPATGPQNWARMNPDFAQCAEGRQQSPINIVGAAPQQLPQLRFSYGLSKLSILNNGHTIQVNIDPGQSVEVLGDRYELKQFHFHTPSEEMIGGKPFAMVAHLVHKSEAGRLAVVAVLFKEGQANPLIDTLWSRLPGEHGETRSFDGQMISPANLLPNNAKYFTFDGSLTTPPCSEGVRWIVLKTPVELSKAQLARFRQMFPMNARPVQPLNGREVLESM